MKLTDCIAYADRIKPNAFTDEDKTRWISELEGMVCTEVFQIDASEFRPYALSASYTAEGICFPEADLIRLKSPIPDEFPVGGLINLSTGAGSIYAENSGSTKYRITAISPDGCGIRIDGNLPATGHEEDTADWTLAYDGAETVLLVRPPHDKIYWSWLVAQIDFANGEYNKYENSLRMFNGYWGEYLRWFSRNFRPADRDVSKTGAYLSAYTVAVKHGFRGTEEEWLRSLHGEDGSSGVWISDDLSNWPDGTRRLWILRGNYDDGEVAVPDGIGYANGALFLLDGSEQIGAGVNVQIGLPDVTEADNGDTLMVVNGVWTKTPLEEWTGGNY